MRYVMGIAGGFLVSLFMFAAGAWFAIMLLTSNHDSQPARGQSAAYAGTEVSDLGQAQEKEGPVPSDGNDQAAGSRSISPDGEPTSTAGDVNSRSTPSNENESVIASDSQDPTDPAGFATSESLSEPHMRWCADRYRSYQPATNSYTSYSGAVQPCVSPYLDSVDAVGGGEFVRQEEAIDERTVVSEQAAYHRASGMFATAEHIANCFHRYRSYRPEDNTYQPIGGGPREQCR